jgi:hypothetical protein
VDPGFSRTLLLLALFSMFGPVRSGYAQTPTAQITWEVTNRFRLFAEQKDFDRHVGAWRSDNSGTSKSILETEQALEKQLGGGGWASTVGRVCYDRMTGELPQSCMRDNKREDYFKPDSHLIKLKVKLPPEFSAAQCTWTVGENPPVQKPCSDVVADQRVPDKKSTQARVTATAAGGLTIAADTVILAQDFLIVGLGDSIASGEGNPDKPIALTDTGFCFSRVLQFVQETFYLPGRANAVNVAEDCADHPGDREAWDKAAAGWLFAACHLSLYSYQVRAALALAVENPDISVTFVPLGCTGATIQQGLLGPLEARERSLTSEAPGPRFVGAQLDQLAGYLGAKSKTPSRLADLIFLTVGANDVNFSGLVANIIVTENPERQVAGDAHLIASPNDEQEQLKVNLKNDFGRLRTQLAPFVGGNLDRVVFVTYGDPARHQGGKDCPSSRTGFDSHPAFSVNGAELAKTIDFVEKSFLPALKSYATCDAAAGCSDPAKQRMTFVADHLVAFADHGFCASDDSDPQFDRACFRNGDSFAGLPGGLSNPLACRGHRASEFRPYAHRARWIRTANDSYFTAMTYPWTARSFMDNPSYIHDGRWGLTSVVYGGVLHPTAEGHAAMADAALAAANAVLKLQHGTSAGYVQ